MYTELFAKEKLDSSKQWLKENNILETICGSYAYGCQTKQSDYDVVSIVMDRPESLWPNQYGLIIGFDSIPYFDNFEKKGKENRLILSNKKEVEIGWHSLTNFFKLVSNGSPNLTEVLFVKRELVTSAHAVGYMLRDNRKLFLSLKMYNSFRGYAFSQMERVRKEVRRWREEGKCDNGSRTVLYETSGYDTKMCYHSLRLLDIIQQILTTGDIDLMNNKEESKVMRAGDWGPWEKFEPYFTSKLNDLEKIVNSGKLLPIPIQPQIIKLHSLLKNCIEEYYGNNENILRNRSEFVSASEVMDELKEIKQIIQLRTTPNNHWYSST